MEKGFLSKAQEKFIANAIDTAIKLKGIPEMLDGIVAKAMITALDDYLLDKVEVTEVVKSQISLFVDKAMAGNVEECETIAASITNSLVDIPGIDEEAEGLIFKAAVNLIVGAVKKYIIKK